MYTILQINKTNTDDDDDDDIAISIVRHIAEIIGVFVFFMPVMDYTVCIVVNLWYNKLESHLLLLNLKQIVTNFEHQCKHESMSKLENKKATIDVKLEMTSTGTGSDESKNNINGTIDSMNINSNEISKLVKNKDKNKNKNEKTEDLDIYQWCIKNYKTVYDDIHERGLNMINFAIMCGICGWCIVLWSHLTTILNYIFINNVNLNDVIYSVLIIIIGIASILIIVLNLCQMTQYYFGMRGQINKLLITNYARNNQLFWKQCIEAEKLITVYPMRGQAKPCY